MLKYTITAGCVAALLVGLMRVLPSSRPEPPLPVSSETGAGIPHSITVHALPGEPESLPGQADEPRWGRAEITWDPEHWPPNRSDWSDDPSNWELRSVAHVLEIAKDVRDKLTQLDCAIPVWRSGATSGAVVTGEFERAGQVDLAVLCVHSDKSSSTYVFWGGNASKRDTMPESGSSINVVTRAGVEARVDVSRPLDPDMPVTVEHDAIEIGCCECCSTIFYRHQGQWFTLPGAD